MGESKNHKLLKDIGIGILLNKGCTPVGVEVTLPIGCDLRPMEREWNERKVTDVAGLINHSVPTGNKVYPTRGVPSLYAIEVKVSRADFKSGYCDKGYGKMWLLTTPDVIKEGELPKGIGHIEVDLKTMKMKHCQRASFTGMEIDKFSQNIIYQHMHFMGYVEGMIARFKHQPEIVALFDTQLHRYIQRPLNISAEIERKRRKKDG